MPTLDAKCLLKFLPTVLAIVCFDAKVIGIMIIQYIDTPEKLAELCQSIKNESWIALDTEFLREKTYYPKFCLLQIATPEWVACVDPLVLRDLTPLFEVLYDENITKVLHACRQDLEIFYQITGRVMAPVFDTQIAAPLLGFQENPGYAMLVSSFLNVNLSKAHTRTDWSERPLNQDQIQYAADDVIYLCKIYQKMTAQLEKLGRLDWLKQDFEILTDPALYQIDPEQAWLRIRGKNKLTGRQLSIVQLLAQWREMTAQQSNRPRNWLMRDDILFELAKLQPVTVAELAKIRQINDGLIRRHGKVLCDLVKQGRERAPTPLNEKGRPGKKGARQEAVLDVLTAVVRIRSEENALNPVILAGRKDLERLLDGDPETPVLHGWRYSMVGKELEGLLQGQLALRISPDTVSLTPSVAMPVAE